MEENLITKLETLARRDGRYAAEGFLFLLRSLNTTVEEVAKRAEPGHVTGRELLEGVRLRGLTEYGYLARTVFESWGVRTTRDFGEMVFLLVNENLMGRSEQDSVEDFDDVYDFEQVFETDYHIDIKDVRS